jgi:hypothetical protein
LIQKLCPALIVSQSLLAVRMQPTAAASALKQFRGYSLLDLACFDGTIITAVSLTTLTQRTDGAQRVTQPAIE